MPGGYDSANDAAAAALMRIGAQPDSDKLEYIGLIYQDPESGRFLFTDPQTADMREHSRGTFAIPKGSLRALIHNHPGDDPGARYFSGDDIEQARALGVPSFIGVEDSLLRWTGETMGHGRRERGLAEEVLAQIPIEEISARMEQRLADHRAEMFAGMMQ